MTDPQSGSSGGPVKQASGNGLTIVVLKDDKIAEIMDAGRTLLETQFRHNLELAKSGFNPDVLKEGDGCCNCVAC